MNRNTERLTPFLAAIKTIIVTTFFLCSFACTPNPKQSNSALEDTKEFKEGSEVIKQFFLTVEKKDREAARRFFVPELPTTPQVATPLVSSSGTTLRSNQFDAIGVLFERDMRLDRILSARKLDADVVRFNLSLVVNGAPEFEQRAVIDIDQKSNERRIRYFEFVFQER